MTIATRRAPRALALMTALVLTVIGANVDQASANELPDQGVPELGGTNAPKIAKRGANLMVVWAAPGSTGDFEIFGQRLSAFDGSTLGHELHINTVTRNSQRDAVIATLKDGNYVIAWASRNFISGQRLNAVGKKIGPEFQIDSGSLGLRNNPAIAVLADGRFVVAWEEQAGHNRPSRIYGQIFTAAGKKLGSRLLLGSGQAFDNHPDIAALKDGGFALVWIRGNPEVQRYDANGRSNGPVVTLPYGSDARVAALRNGGFVVVWSWYTLNSCCVVVQGQRFGADGTAIGRPFRAGPTRYHQHQPAVATLVDGGFVVVWVNNRKDVCGRRFKADALPVGNVFCARISNGNYVESPAVVALGLDRFGIAVEMSDAITAGVLDVSDKTRSEPRFFPLMERRQ